MLLVKLQTHKTCQLSVSGWRAQWQSPSDLYDLKHLVTLQQLSTVIGRHHLPHSRLTT